MATKTKVAEIIASGDATITFEDHGQDFLQWDIKDRKVVACRPFQADLWLGSEVLTFPEVGKTVEISMPRVVGGRRMWVKYPLAKVEAFVQQEGA